MQTQTGRLQTVHASKYLQQLCKHFAHKIEVRYDATRGEADMSSGSIRLNASPEELVVVVSGEDDEALARARDVVDRHLVPFAHREAVTGMVWEAAVAA